MGPEAYVDLLRLDNLRHHCCYPSQQWTQSPTLDIVQLGDMDNMSHWLDHQGPQPERAHRVLNNPTRRLSKTTPWKGTNANKKITRKTPGDRLHGSHLSGRQPDRHYPRFAITCPFYLPKHSHAGRLLAVKDGIDQMLEQVALTEAEREALEGDRDSVAALAERLADTPPSLGRPTRLGTNSAFVSLTALRDNLRRQLVIKAGSVLIGFPRHALKPIPVVPPPSLVTRRHVVVVDPQPHSSVDQFPDDVGVTGMPIGLSDHVH
jgi:hypothetical protein